ncbi:MAG: phosphoribosylanthranilate isomerase [Prochloraceae cyanobacterium]|nr:phosphoribosylanthranilate isomerase [Prochloraceae cyanobacterium]
MRVKICGITKLEQGRAIVNLGATALGFICTNKSPRYIKPASIKSIISQLPKQVDRVGVFVNSSISEISQVVKEANLTAVQLHGDESVEFCQQLRQNLPEIELIKAISVKTKASLEVVTAYTNCVHTLLLDAYHPNLRGGTGKSINWEILKQFKPSLPWLLAGGLTPDNIIDAIETTEPNGIDLSSGVERSPGDKDLDKVAQLFAKLKKYLD